MQLAASKCPLIKTRRFPEIVSDELKMVPRTCGRNPHELHGAFQ